MDKLSFNGVIKSIQPRIRLPSFVKPLIHNTEAEKIVDIYHNHISAERIYLDLRTERYQA